MLTVLLALFACSGPDTDTETDVPQTTPWSGDLVPLTSEVATTRGFEHARTLVHMHSPWSHDACDGDGIIDGEVNAECLDDLRSALCSQSIDVAFFSDHPSNAADQTYEQWSHPQAGDTPAMLGSVQVGDYINCDSGHRVLWLPGIEDETMPVAFDRHVADTTDENHRLYNNSDAEAMTAFADAGAVILQAHTEGRPIEQLTERQDLGMQGVEIFNLHAMFAPDIRQEDLGLDPLGWATGIAPFTSPEGTAEPDLMFLGVLENQPPSLEKWNALMQRGPMVAVGGTDAHQNTLPLDLRDGERGDSYRRMMRWFANVLLVTGDTPEAYETALAAGRNYISFHALGTPDNFDFHVEGDDGTIYEMGSTAPSGGIVNVSCPTLSATSPHGELSPEVTVRVYKDGVVWKEGCAEGLGFPIDEDGAYSVQVEITPNHLLPFLGDEPDPFLRPYPWILSNAVRVGL